MTKKNILTIILDTVFIIAFNILFFVNKGINHAAAVWICYGFLHFAYIMFLLTPVIEAKGKTAYLSRLSTYSISFLYFVIELVLTVIIIFNDRIIGTKLIISIQTIITAIFIIVLVTNLLVNDATEKKQMRHDIENDFIKSISAKAKFIESITTDSNLKNRISNMYYSIHSSPIHSCSEVAVYETKIIELLEDLETLVGQDAVAAAEKITEIERFLNKRNLVLKTKH